MSEEAPFPDPAPLARSPSRGWMRFLLALVIVLGGSELVLRFLLFSDQAWVRDMSGGIRRAGLYTVGETSAEFWKLRALFDQADSVRESSVFDAELGWCTHGVQPDRDLPAFQAESERRPVVFFGASYVACLVKGARWQDLLAADPLGATHGMLNYGVGGYGLDQSLLLMRRTFEHMGSLDPLVLIGIRVDGTLPRSAVGLRRLPKPRFELVDRELSLIPVRDETPREYVERHPVGIPSYLWRVLRLAITRTKDRTDVDAGLEINRRILEVMHAELEERGVPHAFVLFHGRQELLREEPSPSERFLARSLTEMGATFLSAKPALREALERSGLPIDEFFMRDGEHYNERANRAFFPSLASMIRSLEAQAR